MQTDADLPDEVDKDNLVQDAEIHHAHSYKLEEVQAADGSKLLKWTDGDCLQRLNGLAQDVHDFHAEGKLDMVRYALAKMTHYRIDALTYPHLFHGQPWSKYHEKFETHMGKFLVANQDQIGSLVFLPYKDLYKAARETALKAWYEGRDLVEKLEKGEGIPDDLALIICRSCVYGVGSLWLTLATELKVL